MPLNPGTTLGPYAVTAKIGEGGMGEVYRVRDTKLDRDVALKVLPEAFTQDPDRLARFEREAKVLASLNHPNIAAIYGLEEAGDTRALVLELVEGPTLADRIKQGPIPLDEALPIAKQIAEALEAAHEAGVIHRDLKPANIKVRDDGMVKVLDFGLAKAVQSTSAGGLEESPPLTTAMTATGVILGTAAYMSPEQARGEIIDRRTDVWAFGCVLFEILTGTRPFAGSGVSEVLAEVLKGNPDWTALPNDTPPLVRRLLRRCLDKNPKERLQHVGDARADIRDALAMPLAGDTGGAQTTLRGGRSGTALRVSVGTLATFAIGLGTWFASSNNGSDVTPRTVRFELTPAPAPGGAALGRSVAIAPNGTDLAYGTEGNTLVLHSLESDISRVLFDDPGPGNSSSPFFSPDGEWVAFFGGVSAELRRVSTHGGVSATIASSGARALGGSWGPDDTVVYATTLGLFGVPAEGGDPEPLVAPNAEDGELFYAWPEFLPGGRAVLFTIIPEGSTASARIAVLDLKTLDKRTLVQEGSGGRYATSGHLLFSVGSKLHAVAFDVDTLAVRGEPVPLMDEDLILAYGTGGSFRYLADRDARVSGESGCSRGVHLGLGRSRRARGADFCTAAGVCLSADLTRWETCGGRLSLGAEPGPLHLGS